MDLARILGYLLLVLLCCHSDAQVINIAKGGTADQSDTFGGLNATYGPQKANNEDYDDFSHTTDGPNKWWRLDLGREHQIGRIELFNRPGNNTVHQYYERLKNICILTAINNSPNQHPSCDSPHWTNRHNQTEPYGPVGIRRFNSPVTARYVAISKFNDGIYLALVEVEVYESDLPAPSLRLQIKSYVPSCVSLSWSNPTFNVGTINRYEYKCATGPSDDKYAHRWIEASNSQTTAEVCDFQPSTEVTCSVTAVVIGGASQQETLSILTSGNLAYGKTSKQSSNFNNDNKYLAPLAVNGIIDGDSDFTHTDNNEPKKWWSVDLGTTRDIGRVELYNRRGNCGPAELCCKQMYFIIYEWDAEQTRFATATFPVKSDNRLAQISILISTEESPQNPILNMRPWTNESYQQEPYGPVGIIQFDERVPARHVNVYSGNADILSLAEVEIYASTDLSRPLHLTVMNRSTDCVELSWSSPGDIAGEVRRYEMLCSKYKWTNLHQNLSHTVCGYLPYESVTCSLIAVVHSGASQEDKGSTFTNCASPEVPTLAEDNIDKEVVDHLGRKRWKYTITWERPSRVNCHGDLSYQCRIDGILGDVLTEEIPVELYLDGGQAYNFSLVYMNSHGRSVESIISDTSNQLAPQFNNSDLQLSSSNSNCIVLTARSPQFPGGTLTSLQYKCTEKEWTDMQTNIEGKRICGYQPYTEVTCSVRAQNSEYEKTISQTVYTLCEVPDGPEVMINVTKGERDGRKVWKYVASWTPPGRVNCNGSLSYIYGINGTLDSGITRDTSKMFYLDGYQLYNVTVLAVYSHGNSTLVTRSGRSDVIEPATPPTLESLESTESCVTITVLKPSVTNGPIQYYQLDCISSKSSMNKTVPAEDENGSAELCGFDSATSVTCSAVAINGAGDSPPVYDSTYTKIKVQPEDKPKISEPIDGGVPVHITKPKGIHPDITISWYLLMLSPIKTVFKRSQTDKCDEHFALNPKNFSSSTPGECYVTAELSGKEVGDELVFNIGDDKVYGSYYNARLVEKKKYNLYLAVAVEVEEQEGPLVKVMAPVTLTGPEVVVKEQPNTTPAVPPTGIIVGGTVGGVAAAIAVTVIILFVRRRKRETAKHPPKDTELSTIICSDGSSENQASKYSVPSPALDEDHYQHLITTVIQVRDLEMYVRNNVDHIYEQYKDLEKLPRPKMDVAQKLENTGRCRYKGLYPSDEHRVILNRENEGNDFINASYIAGYSKDNAYIASQGPSPANVNDFWYMIWQEQPSAIVMIMRAIENGKKKCEQYWPLDKDTVMKYGDISVSVKSVETWADFTQTHLTISKGDQSRSLSHFNYLSWPDHGVPDDLGSYIAFYTQVKCTISRSTRALLIHCSAGVGRTGTYIALEYLIQQAKKENIVDRFACVERMRKRRPCMVQTDDQYMFLYKLLAEFLVIDSFKCSPSELEIKLQSHKQGRSRNQASRIVAEFQHLERRLAAINFSNSTLQDDRMAKNRTPDFLPCNKYVPSFSKTKGTHVNAVLVDSYTQKNQWIATQLPLSNTITDFWQLVIEQNIGIIVQLESTEMPFYPMNDMATLSTSMRSLIRGGSEESGSIEKIPLTVQTGLVDKSIHVMRLKAWNEASQTFPSPEVLLTLCGAVEELQKRTNPAKICVTCLNGATRCGLFICAFDAIEKLKNEQVVDIYGPTAMAKMRRPQFISPIDEYAFLYEALKNYTHSFAEYVYFI